MNDFYAYVELSYIFMMIVTALNAITRKLDSDDYRYLVIAPITAFILIVTFPIKVIADIRTYFIKLKDINYTSL